MNKLELFVLIVIFQAEAVFEHVLHHEFALGLGNRGRGTGVDVPQRSICVAWRHVENLVGL